MASAALSPKAYARLPTERPNPASKGLDRLDAHSVVRLINREDAAVARAVGRQARQIARAAEAAARALSRGGSLVFIGAGTSGRLGVMEAAECPPTFGTRPRQVRAVMAGGPAAVFLSKEGAEDDARAGARVARTLSRRDMLVGIAASGVTPFVRAALAAARRRGAATALITCNQRPPRNPARITIAPVVGPEVLAGSTRMKSGTATKLILNALTTAAMVRLGKVYDQYMVDLRLTSRKLKLRAVRIVSILGRVPAARARRLLFASGGRVKTAVVMGRLKLSRRDAERRLAAARGFLRKALGEQ